MLKGERIYADEVDEIDEVPILKRVTFYQKLSIEYWMYAA